MAFAGELAVAITGSLKGLKASFKEAKQETRNLKRSFQRAGERISGLGQKMTMLVTGPIAAVTAGIGTAALKTGQYARQIQKSSEATGLAVEDYQELKFALEQLGVQQDDTEEALVELNRKMGEAANGSKDVAKAFGAIGISQEQLRKGTISTNEAFNKAVEALSQMESQQRKTIIASKLFSEDISRRMIPALNAGADEIDKLRQRANELGVIMSEQAVQNAVDFQEKIKSLTKQFRAAFHQIALQFIPMLKQDLIPAIRNNVIPAISSFADQLGKLVQWYTDLSPPMQTFINLTTITATVVGPLLMVIGKVVSTIGTLIPLIKGIGIALGATQAPILAGITALTGLATVATLIFRNWKEVKGLLVALWKNTVNQAKLLTNQIKLAWFKVAKTVKDAINNLIVKQIAKLENLPFGLGDKFAKMSESIKASSGKIQAKINELKQKNQDLQENASESYNKVEQSAKDLSSAIVGDVKNAIDGLVNLINGTAEAANNFSASLKESVFQTKKQKQETIKLNGPLEAAEQNLLNIASAANKAKSQIKPLTVTTKESVFADKKKKQSTKDLIGTMQMLENQFQNQSKAMLGNLQLSDELQNKLDVVSKKEQVFGNSMNVAAEKARILKRAIKEKLKSHDVESEVVQNLISLYNKYKKQSEDAAGDSKTAWEKAMENIKDEIKPLAGLGINISFDVDEEKAIQAARRIRSAWNSMANQIGSLIGQITVNLANGTAKWGQILANFGNIFVNIIQKMIAQWIAAQIKSMAAQSTWLTSVIATMASAAQAFLSAAYAALVSFFSFLGPGAPAAAGAVIASAITAMGALSIKGISALTGGSGGSTSNIDTDIDTDSGGGDTGSDSSSSSSGGRKISEITGPTRDLLTDLLSPLANLNQLTGIGNRIYDLLDQRLQPVAAAGGGTFNQQNITFREGAIQVDATGSDVSEKTIDEIEENITERLQKDRRGGR